METLLLENWVNVSTVLRLQLSFPRGWRVHGLGCDGGVHLSGRGGQLR